MTGRRASRRSALARIIAPLLSLACGGGDGGSVAPPPPPPAAVALVVLSPDTATLDPGRTLQLTATARDQAGNALAGRTITWTSSDTTKATVTATGLVTATAGGDVTISAESEGKRGEARLAVTDPGLVDVRLASPNAEDAALIFTVTGGRVLGVEGGANEVRSRLSASSGDASVVLVRGAIVPGVVARVRVPDRLRLSSYTLVATQAVARGTYTQRDVRGYVVGLVRP